MKDLTDQESRFLHMLDELQEARGVEVYYEERGPLEELAGDAPTAFARIAEWHGLRLAPELQRAFLRFEGLSSHWAVRTDDIYLTGEFSLTHLAAAMFATGEDLADNDSSTAERALCSELRLFDEQPRTGAGTRTALRMQPDVTSPEIWYAHGEQGLFRLDLDYAEYFDVLLTTKGAFGWQCLFADIDMNEAGFRGAAESVRNLLELFPDLFPGHDYQPLRERLEARL